LYVQAGGGVWLTGVTGCMAGDRPGGGGIAGVMVGDAVATGWNCWFWRVLLLRKRQIRKATRTATMPARTAIAIMAPCGTLEGDCVELLLVFVLLFVDPGVVWEFVFAVVWPADAPVDRELEGPFDAATAVPVTWWTVVKVILAGIGRLLARHCVPAEEKVATVSLAQQKNPANE